MSDHEALREVVLLLAAEAPPALEALLVEEILLNHCTTSSPMVLTQKIVHGDIGIKTVLKMHSIGVGLITGSSPAVPNIHRAVRVRILQTAVAFQATMET